MFLSGIEDEIRAAFGSGGSSGSSSLWLFEHARDHVDFYRVLVRRRGGWQLVSRRIGATLVEIFDARLHETSTKPGAPVEAAAHFLGSSLMGLLTWWLSEGAEYGVEDYRRRIPNVGQSRHERRPRSRAVMTLRHSGSAGP